jgi:hypothetical protein
MRAICRFGILSVIALSLSGSTPPAEASHGCNQRDVQGTYSYTVTGTNVGVGLVAAVGVVTADGEGHLAGADTVSANGTIIRRTTTGSYTVTPSCAGNGAFTDSFGQTTHIDFAVDDHGAELRFIQTDPTTVTTGLARRQ